MTDDLEIDSRSLETGAGCENQMRDAVFLIGEIELIERARGQDEGMALIKAHSRRGVWKSAVTVEIIDGIFSGSIGKGVQERVTMFNLRFERHTFEERSIAFFGQEERGIIHKSAVNIKIRHCCCYLIQIGFDHR